ncbi:hypothetical protein [Corynebacterium auriscanis]|uniref:hypothetical protein n=1 Tax=Corynebacterium auriscanis TaxID=99807 RepID=UPI0012EBAE78|nr:hypothetical protein [Corynebacterium auriscanis]
MSTPFIPLSHEVEVLTPGEPVVDRFGDSRPGPVVSRHLRVAGWWVDRVEEKAGESVLRTIDYLHVHVPVGAEFGTAAKIRLPDGSVWQVAGNPENYDHGPFGFSPGLVVVHALKVEG